MVQFTAVESVFFAALEKLPGAWTGRVPERGLRCRRLTFAGTSSACWPLTQADRFLNAPAARLDATCDGPPMPKGPAR